MVDLDRRERSERVFRDGPIDLRRHRVVPVSKRPWIESKCPQRVRLQRETHVHDLNLVAVRGGEIEHLPSRQEVDRASIGKLERCDVVSQLIPAHGQLLQSGDIDLGREVADVREHSSVS